MPCTSGRAAAGARPVSYGRATSSRWCFRSPCGRAPDSSEIGARNVLATEALRRQSPDDAEASTVDEPDVAADQTLRLP